MINLQGKHNEAVVYTDMLEPQAMSQIIELCSQEFVKDSKIRIMPDVHAGKGCTIGTTMTIKDKVVPNLVGVDIGCVDKDTEFLTTKGFVKISEYNNEEIAVFDKESNVTKFELPLAYIKKEETEFYHLKTKYGVDQMISKEHTCLVEKGSHHKPLRRGELYTIKAEELYNNHNRLKLGFRDNFLCNIPNIQLESSNNLSDAQIRVQIMVMADGHISNTNTKRCVCNFGKERKINRCIDLLNNANIDYTTTLLESGITSIKFTAPIISKRISEFYNANLHQLSIICDELKHWDFSMVDNCYISKHKEDVDFVQYAYAVIGHRTSISHDKRQEKESYRCIISNSKPRVQISGTPKSPIKIVPSEDGYKYCFTTSTGFWIMRRNGCICVTGNCGMFTVKISETSVDFDMLDKTIRKYIPSGQGIRGTHHEYVKYIQIDKLKCIKHVNMERAYKSLGTLGGGNHFIEMNEDSDGNLYIVIHSGSRYLGKQVAEYYQNLAIKRHRDKNDANGEIIKKLKSEGRSNEIQAELSKKAKQEHLPDALCYLEGQDMLDYLHDMNIVQHYASINREAMADVIMNKMNLTEVDCFTTIHNYIETKEDHSILRKGAVASYENEMLLIPINMRDGSILAMGKSNPDWNYSAPHGAGRLMSRSKAKQLVTLEEFQESMNNVWTNSVCTSTIDESPMAYKSIDNIVGNIDDTAEIVDIIKPVYNYKAH